MWAGSDANTQMNTVPSGLQSQRSTGHWWCSVMWMSHRSHLQFMVWLWPRHNLNSRTEPLEELQLTKKDKQNFAVDFSIRIISVSIWGCKLDGLGAWKCPQSLKSHTRVNAAKCSVSVRVRKILSVFLRFYYLSWRIKPPGIINSQRLPV